MEDEPNRVTPDEFRRLKALFHGKMTPKEAHEVLRSAREDRSIPPIIRLELTGAILDIATGKSVQSTMARLRRSTGLDKAK